MEPKSKLSTLLELMDADRWEEAICFAAKFPQLGDHDHPIRLAADMIKYPSFYKQLGKDVGQAVPIGKAALVARYRKA